MSRQTRMVLRALGAFIFVAGVLSGCAPVAPPDPQQQLVNVQRSDKQVYDKSLIAYRALVANPGTANRAQVLESYQALLYQYSVAAGSWARAIYPAARQALPSALQPLPAPSGTPTLADVNRDYERALGMNVTMWEIDGAAVMGRPSKLPVPRYNGAILIMPEAAPLPPLQDARDPNYARLVAMTMKVDAAQKAEINQQRAANAKAIAETAAWRDQYANVNPATGRPYPPPQQPEQRWCQQSGIGWTARVPC